MALNVARPACKGVCKRSQLLQHDACLCVTSSAHVPDDSGAMYTRELMLTPMPMPLHDWGLWRCALADAVVVWSGGQAFD